VKKWLITDEEGTSENAVTTDKQTRAGAGGNPKDIPISGHIGIFKDFLKAVEMDLVPLIDGREGKRSLSTVLKIYQESGIG